MDSYLGNETTMNAGKLMVFNKKNSWNVFISSGLVNSVGFSLLGSVHHFHKILPIFQYFLLAWILLKFSPVLLHNIEIYCQFRTLQLRRASQDIAINHWVNRSHKHFFRQLKYFYKIKTKIFILFGTTGHSDLVFIEKRNQQLCCFMNFWNSVIN